MIQPIQILALFIIGFSIQGIVCTVIYGETAYALLVIACLTLFYAIIS